ncbi:MAG: hypothetical protein LBJ17_04105 [Dysgonamonadaceae bacterium]|jgi:hypothetical protein|nr:hypothetical protein [Dysgonamonadaceae bacterium]
MKTTEVIAKLERIATRFGYELETGDEVHQIYFAYAKNLFFHEMEDTFGSLPNVSWMVMASPTRKNLTCCIVFVK